MVIEQLKKLAESDLDAGVRARAVSVISIMFARSRDADILAMLAQIVTDCDELKSLRAQAYNSLFVVDARASREWPLVRAAGDENALFADIDWDYVACCVHKEKRSRD